MIINPKLKLFMCVISTYGPYFLLNPNKAKPKKWSNNGNKNEQNAGYSQNEVA